MGHFFSGSNNAWMTSTSTQRGFPWCPASCWNQVCTKPILDNRMHFSTLIMSWEWFGNPQGMYSVTWNIPRFTLLTSFPDHSIQHSAARPHSNLSLGSICMVNMICDANDVAAAFSISCYCDVFKKCAARVPEISSSPFLYLWRSWVTH